MYLLDKRSTPAKRVVVVVEPLAKGEIKYLTKEMFHFNWHDLEQTELWKLRLPQNEEILGAMSLSYFPPEYRVEINLIASRLDFVGYSKQYERIAGCLIGWACRQSVKHYGELACVSLTPKTKLIPHYMEKYGLKKADRQLYVDGISLYQRIKTYLDNES